jgi:predicted metalloprotease
VAAIAYVLAMGVGMLVASRFGALELTRTNEESK